MTSNPDDIGPAAHVLTVDQLVVRERESRDRGRWDAMRRCFHEDAQVTLSWFNGPATDFIKGSEALAADGVTGRHRLGRSSIRVAGDRAVVTAPVIAETYPEIDNIACVLSAFARLVYRIERRTGRWAIVRMQAIYERDELSAAPLGPIPRIPQAELAPFRPSYALMSWILGKHGISVPQNLPGDDDPRLADAIHNDAIAWLTG